MGDPNEGGVNWHCTKVDGKINASVTMQMNESDLNLEQQRWLKLILVDSPKLMKFGSQAKCGFFVDG